jgi:hypothetical protein
VRLTQMPLMMQVYVVSLLVCLGICCANAAQYGAKRRVEASQAGLIH